MFKHKHKSSYGISSGFTILDSITFKADDETIKRINESVCEDTKTKEYEAELLKFSDKIK